MSQALLNFSTDLLRISGWIYDGRVELACKFLDRCKKEYAQIDPKIGCYSNLWEELERIKKLEGGCKRAAERASTVSVIMRLQIYK